MTSAELWRLKYVCCLEKLEESVKRDGHCNSAINLSFILFCSLIFFLFFSSEIGELLCMKSKYGPGGEFEPDWYVLSFYFISLFSHILHVGRHLVNHLHLNHLQIHLFHPFLIPPILRLLDLLGAFIILERRKRENQK
jgi:hypothetical protein